MPSFKLKPLATLITDFDDLVAATLEQHGAYAANQIPSDLNEQKVLFQQGTVAPFYGDFYKLPKDIQDQFNLVQRTIYLVQQSHGKEEYKAEIIAAAMMIARDKGTQLRKEFNAVIGIKPGNWLDKDRKKIIKSNYQYFMLGEKSTANNFLPLTNEELAKNFQYYVMEPANKKHTNAAGNVDIAADRKAQLELMKNVFALEPALPSPLEQIDILFNANLISTGLYRRAKKLYEVDNLTSDAVFEMQRTRLRQAELNARKLSRESRVKFMQDMLAIQDMGEKLHHVGSNQIDPNATDDEEVSIYQADLTDRINKLFDKHAALIARHHAEQQTDELALIKMGAMLVVQKLIYHSYYIKSNVTNSVTYTGINSALAIAAHRPLDKTIERLALLAFRNHVNAHPEVLNNVDKNYISIVSINKLVAEAIRPAELTEQGLAKAKPAAGRRALTLFDQIKKPQPLKHVETVVKNIKPSLGFTSGNVLDYMDDKGKRAYHLHKNLMQEIRDLAISVKRNLNKVAPAQEESLKLKK